MGENTKNKSTHSLGFADLYALGVGQVMGAGVFTVMGVAMLSTGKSVWIAYFLAVVLNFIVNWPTFVLSSMARLNGGDYSAAAALVHPIFAGILMVAYIPYSFSLCLFGIALGQYTNSLFPALDARLMGILITTVFFILNLVKIKNMALVQKVMTILLISTLLIFIAFGLTRLNRVPFEFSSPDFFQGGGRGFLTAIILLSYSTQSYVYAVNYSRYAKNPTKTLPNVLWLCLITITVIYTLSGIVASGVLPIGDVAGKPLTFLASTILPGPLFYLFIVGGVLMALATTLNSMFGAFANLLLAGARDGWFPQFMAKLNRFGRPWVLLAIIYVISIIPIIVNLSVDAVTNNIMLIGYTVGLITAISKYFLPKKYPDKCEKSKYFINKAFFFTGVTLTTIAVIFIAVLSASAISPILAAISLSAIAICAIYAILRYRTGKVKIENVFIIEDDGEAA